MKNILKFKLAILASLSSACSIMPNNDFFVPASQDADSAWVRIIDNTEQTSIYQTLNGKRTGGLIRSSEWVLQNTGIAECQKYLEKNTISTTTKHH